MDWQQILALVIVGITAAVFGRQLLRPRRPLESKSPCGCVSAGDKAAEKSSILFTARKGEPPRIIVRPR